MHWQVCALSIQKHRSIYELKVILGIISANICTGEPDKRILSTYSFSAHRGSIKFHNEALITHWSPNTKPNCLSAVIPS